MIEQQKKWNESFKSGRDYNPMNELFLELMLSSIFNKKEIAIDLGCVTGDAVVKFLISSLPINKNYFLGGDRIFS